MERRSDDSEIQKVMFLCASMQADIKHILERQTEHALLQKEWQKHHIDKDHSDIEKKLSEHSNKMNGMVVASCVAVIGTLLSFIGWLFR